MGGIPEWIAETFGQLPGCTDDVFLGLWDRGRLTLSDQYKPDALDGLSARLVSASVSKRKSLFVVLPDNRSQRAPLMFATAAIRSWADSRGASVTRMRVLYVGSTIGVREQMHATTVRGLGVSLADMFDQSEVGRNGHAARPPNSATSGLPWVITSYAPADPDALLDAARPYWIAVDCSDGDAVVWLPGLLSAARDRGIPVLGWTSNPLIAERESFGPDLIVWPRQAIAAAGPIDADLIGSALAQGITSKVEAMYPDGEIPERVSQLLREASQRLGVLNKRSSGRVEVDAIRIHYRLLRALERLSVPQDFFDVEAQRYWGVQSMSRLLEGCEHYRKACGGTEIARELMAIGGLLAETMQIQRDEPPLWRALGEVALQGPESGQLRAILFHSRAASEMFGLAMLARYNISEAELRSLGTVITSVGEFRKGGRSSTALVNNSNLSLKQVEPVLVGLPGWGGAGKLTPILEHPRVPFVCHAHQIGLLRWLSESWSNSCGPSVRALVSTLASLAGKRQPLAKDPISQMAIFAGAIAIPVAGGEIHPNNDVMLWEVPDDLVEASRILEATGDTDSFESEGARPPREKEDEDEVVWVDEAVYVVFDESRKALFAPDDQVNVVVRTSRGIQTEKRFVKALRPEDVVVLIHGQRRQDLYDLLISRVHRHPALELHVVLVEQWPQVFRKGFEAWRIYGVRGLDELLQLMRERGCKLTSSFTLRQWLWGTTLCPDDPRDLRRLGEVLNLPFLTNYFPRIQAAATRLRGLHIGLSLRLNRWLESRLTRSAAGDVDEVVDEELGLRFGDFKDSLMLLTVKEARVVSGPFLKTELGRVSEAEEARE